MAFATIGTAGIQAQSVDLTSKVTGTLPVPNGGLGIASGTTDQFLKFTGTETLASAADNAGALVKVGSVQSNSAAGSHDLTGIFSDTYDKYFFSLSTFPITAGQYIYMQFLDGSNNPLTSGYYGVAWGREQGPDNATQNYTFSGSTSAIKLNDSTSNGRAWQGQGYIVGPTSGIASNKAVTWQQASYNSDNDMISMVGGFTNVLTTDATGMRIYSGVNLTAISLQVYGVVDTKNYNG